MGQLLSLLSALFRERHLELPRPSLQEESILLQQPLDILYSICEHLPTEDVISLSLSCKDLYIHLFPNAERRRSIDRDDFLIRLEKDIPGRCYCFCCKRLHHIRKGRDEIKRDRFIDQESSTVRLFMGCGLMLTYNQARAVMNSHFLGHGIQPETLCQQHRYRHYVPCYDRPSWVFYTEVRKTAIIGDELFSSMSREYESPTGTYDDLTTFVQETSAKPCNHVCEDFATLEEYMLMDGHQTPGSCGTCLTDWEATVHRQHDSVDGDYGVGWKVTLVSFHQLGGCRSPAEWKWANMFEMPSGGRVNRSSTRNHAPGSVRRKWRLGPFGSQGTEPDRYATVFFPGTYTPAAESMPAPGPELHDRYPPHTTWAFRCGFPGGGDPIFASTL